MRPRYSETITTQRFNRERKLQTNPTHEHRCKDIQYIIPKLNPKHTKKITHHDYLGFISEVQGWFIIQQLPIAIYHIKKNVKRNIIISLYVLKAIHKIQQPFIVKFWRVCG